jgi:hypothetical protein
VALFKFTPEQGDACIRVAAFLMRERLRRLDVELFRTGHAGSCGRPCLRKFHPSMSAKRLGVSSSVTESSGEAHRRYTNFVNDILCPKSIS